MPEHQPRARGGGGATGGEMVPPYVRLTQRGRPPRERRRMWILLAVVLAAHVLLAWIAYLILRPTPYHRNTRNVVQIFLIQPTPETPAPPLVPPPPLPGQPALPPPRVHYVPPAKGAMRATLESAKGQPLELYDQNGQIRLPSGKAQKPTPAPAYSTPEITGSHIYSGRSPVPYTPTRFNKDWAPANQSLGAKAAAKVGEVFDKAVDKTTLKKTIKVGGTKIHCAISPLLLGAGCAPEPPPPPPKNDNDIRLSMPPAETLTGKKVPLPKSASSAPRPSSASTPASASSR